MSKGKVAAFLLLVCVMLGMTACGKKDAYTGDGKQILTIGYLPITHALSVFESKEILDKKKDSSIVVELKKFGSWSDLMDALNCGQIDGASVLAELAMNARSQGINLRAVALGHKDGNVIVVSNEIKSVKDLKGKTFAIPSNQSSHNILLQELLREEQMTIEELQVVQLAPAEMVSSLASGSIDGYCVAEPFGTQAVVSGTGHVLKTSEELWKDSICCAMVFHGGFLERHSDKVKEFLQVYTSVGESLDQEHSLEVASRYLGQDASVLEESFRRISFSDLEIKKKDYEVLANKVEQYEINEEPPTFDDFVYTFDNNEEVNDEK